MILRARTKDEGTPAAAADLERVARGGAGRGEIRRLAAAAGNRWRKVKPHVFIYLIGRPNDGKTVVNAAFVDFAIGHQHDMRDRVELIEISPGLALAYEDLKDGRWPEKTAPEDAGDEPAEKFVFRIDTTVVALVSPPGEALRIDGGITPAAVEKRFGDGIIAVVFNAFRYDAEIAAKALVGLVCTLQAAPLNHTLVNAVRIAYELLFGLNEEELKARLIDYADVCRYEGSRLRWWPARDGRPGRVAVQLGKESPNEPNTLMRALRNLSNHAVKTDLDVHNLRQLTRKLPGILVVLARMNLLVHIPSLTESDFNVIFEDAFGMTQDHWVSQRVVASGVRLFLRSDPKLYYRIDDIEPAGGRELFRSVVRALSRTKVSEKRRGVLSLFGWGRNGAKAAATTPQLNGAAH